jgi:hypothetical protein
MEALRKQANKFKEQVAKQQQVRIPHPSTQFFLVPRGPVNLCRAMCCEAVARIWRRDLLLPRLSCGWILCFDANFRFLGLVDLQAVRSELGPKGCVVLLVFMVL